MKSLKHKGTARGFRKKLATQLDVLSDMLKEYGPTTFKDEVSELRRLSYHVIDKAQQQESSL